MTIYPDEQKTRLIERMLAPNSEPVSKRSRETGIPEDTLYTWRRQAQRQRGLKPAAAVGAGERGSGAEKFAMVVEAAVLSEAARGEYCRKRGVYPEPLQRWHQACEQATAVPAATSRGGAAPRAADRRRLREVERELRRKGKARAEAAAVRVVRKKARAIWGEAEAE